MSSSCQRLIKLKDQITFLSEKLSRALWDKKYAGMCQASTVSQKDTLLSLGGAGGEESPASTESTQIKGPLLRVGEGYIVAGAVLKCRTGMPPCLYFMNYRAQDSFVQHKSNIMRSHQF